MFRKNRCFSIAFILAIMLLTQLGLAHHATMHVLDTNEVKTSAHAHEHGHSHSSEDDPEPQNHSSPCDNCVLQQHFSTSIAALQENIFIPATGYDKPYVIAFRAQNSFKYNAHHVRAPPALLI